MRMRPRAIRRAPARLEGALMRPWTSDFVGRYDEATIDSAALRGNPLGDSAQRPLWAYLPPGYDDHPERRYPVIYLIQGYTGSLDMWRNRTAFRPTALERIDDLFAGPDAAPPALVVGVDAWTAYGGSQFVDSPGTGRYHTYLCEDVVPFVDARWRTIPERDARAIAGKSSGGFGAMITPMLRPDLFGAFASHAGDSLYEYCYLKEFADATRALRDSYGGSYDAFWRDFHSRVPMSRDTDATLVVTYGVAACFSADPDGTVRLPFDPATGQVVPEVWQRWLDWDPVRMVPKYAEALRSQRGIWVDAGRNDDYYLDLGAEAFVAELAAVGVTDVAFELFDGTHRAIEYRYPLAMRYLAERLAR
jgi:S-formylglutathione hydrolase FrmB